MNSMVKWTANSMIYDLNGHFQELQNNLDKLHKEQLIELLKKIRKKDNGITITLSPELINLNK